MRPINYKGLNPKFRVGPTSRSREVPAAHSRGVLELPFKGTEDACGSYPPVRVVE